MVPKQNRPGKFRMVIDLRPLNSRVLPTALPMPNLEIRLRAVTKAQCFGCFDVLSGVDNLTCKVLNKLLNILLCPLSKDYTSSTVVPKGSVTVHRHSTVVSLRKLLVTSGCQSSSNGLMIAYCSAPANPTTWMLWNDFLFALSQSLKGLKVEHQEDCLHATS